MFHLLVIMSVVAMVTSFLGFGGVIGLNRSLGHLLLPVALILFGLAVWLQFRPKRTTPPAP